MEKAKKKKSVWEKLRRMRKITSKETQEMTAEEAWNIILSFAGHLTERKKFIEYENVLPYERDVIRIAFYNIINNEKSLKRRVFKGESVQSLRAHLLIALYHLETGFIPDKEKYRETVQLMKMGNESLKIIAKKEKAGMR